MDEVVPHSYDDSSFLQRLRRRDPEAQAHFLRFNRSMLQATALGVLKSRADADPLVADVLTDFLYSNVHQVEHERAIPAYLRSMVIRRARRLVRQWSRVVDIDKHDLPDLDKRDLVEALDDKTLIPWLQECVSRLKDGARRFLRLHYGHGMDTVEIARHYGITKQAVSKTILKSIPLLRRCLNAKADRGRRGNA